MKLFFSKAFTGSDWLVDVLITVGDDGTIEAVESKCNSSDADEIFVGICLPGLPNLHSHAFQRAMAGLTEIAGAGANNFWTWQKVMYEFLAKLSPDDAETIAAQLYMEMLKGGYTTVGEFHYLHHDKNGAPYDDPAEMSDRIFAASETTGIALTHLPVLYAHGGFGAQEAQEGQRRFLHSVDQFGGLLEILNARYGKGSKSKIGMALHSLRAVSPEMIDEAIGLVPEGPIHVHIAEQIKEVEQCINWSDKRPVKWLLDHTNVDDKWCFIHATHMTDAETEEFAETGAVAGLCPTTEANLGDGLFPLEQFLNLNGRFGIGSDSNTSVDAAEELRLLEYGQRLSQLRRNVSALTEGSSTGESLFRAALAGGAQALDQPTGVLTPGNRADIVVLDGRHPVLAGREESSILDSWIFTGGRELITDVFVAGNHMVKAGHHIHQDTIENRYRDTIEKLMRSE